MPRDDSIYLRHMADAIRRVNEFVGDVSETESRRRRIVQSAVLRELEIIGE
jgi:uncharacterized protein with HEPN domain